jgi:hypothetical protein
VVYLCNRILLGNKSELTIDTCNSMDKSKITMLRKEALQKGLKTVLFHLHKTVERSDLPTVAEHRSVIVWG